MRRSVPILALALLCLFLLSSCGFNFPVETGPAGGLVFYDMGSYSEGWRYLKAAPYDQSDGIPWDNGANLEIGTGTAVGTGKANTETIVAAQGPGKYAAATCAELVLGGYDDWFLPSDDELDLMYTTLKKAGLGGFGEGSLWSSTNFSSGLASFERFSDGYRDADNKENQFSVRAIRAY